MVYCLIPATQAYIIFGDYVHANLQHQSLQIKRFISQTIFTTRIQILITVVGVGGTKCGSSSGVRGAFRMGNKNRLPSRASGMDADCVHGHALLSG